MHCVLLVLERALGLVILTSVAVHIGRSLLILVSQGKGMWYRIEARILWKQGLAGAGKGMKTFLILFQSGESSNSLDEHGRMETQLHSNTSQSHHVHLQRLNGAANPCYEVKIEL